MVSATTLRDYATVLGPLGLIKAIFRRSVGRVGLDSVQHSSLSHPVWLRVPSTDVMVFKQVVIDREYLIRGQPRTIVDAGANVGLASVVFASLYPDARILAIEPEPGNFEILRRNCEPYPGVTPIRAALWREDGKAWISDQGIGDWGFSVSDTTNCGIEVETLTVGTLMERHGFDRIDLFKVDIEGGEQELFEGDTDWLDRIDAIAIELHEHFRPGSSAGFLRAAEGFEHRWSQGENQFASRGATVSEAPR